MRNGGSKAKGSANERKTAKELSLWYYGEPNVLVRSDGIAPTNATIRGVHIALNDVLQGQRHDDPFPFVVELKHYRDPISVHDVFSPTSLFAKAWIQCATAMHDGTRRPLLIYRTNNRPAVAAVTLDDYLGLQLYSPARMSVITSALDGVAVMPAEEFLTVDNAARIRTAVTATWARSA